MDSVEEKSIITQYTDECIGMMKAAHIVLPKQATVNIYHHRGKARLAETGAMFINVVNRDYCKSVVVMTAGQSYPNHYHRIKTESFYVLHGELTLTIDGEQHKVLPGELMHIERGQDHAFSTDKGVVFEEISTVYMPNDSVYTDDDIAKTNYTQRRTTLNSDEWKEITENA